MPATADPIVSLAHARIIKASADLEVALSEGGRGGPAIEMLRRLRNKAAESLAGLATCNIFTKDGRELFLSLQNEVKRYDEWVADMRAIIQEGINLDAEMKEDERMELLDILSGTSEGTEELRRLGLIPEEQPD